MTTVTSSSLDTALGALRRGEIVALEHGERALLVSPAALATEATLVTYESWTSAPVALALDSDTFDALGLGTVDPLPAADSPVGRPIDVGVTGIDAMSRRARAHTMAQIGQGATEVVFTPGHVPTVRSSPGNLLSRVGLVEAAIDLIALSGLRPAAVIAFLVDEAEVLENLIRMPLTEVRTAALTAAGGVRDAEVKSLFIGGMSRLIAPVAIVTSSPDGATPHGMVVSSLTSFSSEPPSVVFSAALTTRSYATLHNTERFGVHILAHGQDDLVSRFASRASDKFAGVEWEMRDGVPLLRSVQTLLSCRKIGELRLGDHALFVGAILDGEASEREPMVYFDRRFTWELATK